MTKGIKIKLNTGEGQVSFKTQKIKGKLNCVIVDVSEGKGLEHLQNPYSNAMPDVKVDLIIESALGYLILKRSQINNISYFAPRVRIVPSEDNMRDILTFDKFNLNEEIIITIIGPKNTEVNLIFRFD